MEWEDLITGILIMITVLSVISLGIYGFHIGAEKKYNNFQATIGDLNDEQKCLHICGFQYPGSTLFDNYKFCVEKCDRISERSVKCGV